MVMMTVMMMAIMAMKKYDRLPPSSPVTKKIKKITTKK